LETVLLNRCSGVTDDGKQILEGQMPMTGNSSGAVPRRALLALALAALVAACAVTEEKGEEGRARGIADNGVTTPVHDVSGRPIPGGLSGPGSVQAPGTGSDAPEAASAAGGHESAWRIEHSLRLPARLAFDPGGSNLYVSDPLVGSVFRLDSKLTAAGELKGLDKPLGLAVGRAGMLFVGNDGRDDIEVFLPDGTLHAVLAPGLVKMPNVLLFEPGGRLVVADSSEDRIVVLDVEGQGVSVFNGAAWPGGPMRFPSALAVLPGPDGRTELYVADQVNCRVVVCDVSGAWKRTLGGPAEAFSDQWKGRFTRLQALAFDSKGQLHVLDSYQHTVQVIDPASGEFVDAYGKFGRGPAELNNPLDLLMVGGNAFVASAGNHRVQALAGPGERP